jgi:hypothetical protein
VGGPDPSVEAQCTGLRGLGFSLRTGKAKEDSGRKRPTKDLG